MQPDKTYEHNYLEDIYNPIEHRRKTNLVNEIIKTIDKLVEDEDFLVLRYSSVRYIAEGIKVRIPDKSSDKRSKNATKVCTVLEIKDDEVKLMVDEEEMTMPKTEVLPCDLHKTVLTTYFPQLFDVVKKNTVEFYKDDIDLLNCLCDVIGIDITTGYNNLDVRTQYGIYTYIKTKSSTDDIDFNVL